MVKNESITLEGLQPHNKMVEQLTPNTEYIIQTHAIYQMTDYNANEDLVLYSSNVTKRTDGGY